MARGITESDVHTAADELVANGERPTVERVRAHLGTGSPNTVTRWLDTWWKNLGVRLQPKRPDLKDAPAVLAELAGQWWALALQHARESVLEELADAKQTLAADYDELRVQRQAFADEVTELHAKADAALSAERIAAAQVVELQRFIDQLQSQAAEQTRQRSSMAQRLDQTESARQELDARLQELQESAKSERDSLTEYARSVETRALKDLDTARQEVKMTLAKLNSMEKQHAKMVATHRESLERSQAAARESAAAARIERTRVELLQAQLSKLQDIPAALEAVLRKSMPSAAAQTLKRRSKKPS